MTKKKQRTKLARGLRIQGIKGARAFKVAAAVVKAGHPTHVSAETLETLGLGHNPGGWSTEHGQHFPAQVFCLSSGGCVLTAWGVLHA